MFDLIRCSIKRPVYADGPIDANNIISVCKIKVETEKRNLF